MSIDELNLKLDELKTKINNFLATYEKVNQEYTDKLKIKSKPSEPSKSVNYFLDEMYQKFVTLTCSNNTILQPYQKSITIKDENEWWIQLSEILIEICSQDENKQRISLNLKSYSNDSKKYINADFFSHKILLDYAYNDNYQNDLFVKSMVTHVNKTQYYPDSGNIKMSFTSGKTGTTYPSTFPFLWAYPASLNNKIYSDLDNIISITHKSIPNLHYCVKLFADMIKLSMTGYPIKYLIKKIKSELNNNLTMIKYFAPSSTFSIETLKTQLETDHKGFNRTFYYNTPEYALWKLYQILNVLDKNNMCNFEDLFTRDDPTDKNSNWIFDQDTLFYPLFFAYLPFIISHHYSFADFEKIAPNFVYKSIVDNFILEFQKSEGNKFGVPIRALLCGFIGDILGSHYEFLNKNEARCAIMKEYPGKDLTIAKGYPGGGNMKISFNWSPGSFTDDSQMAMAALNALMIAYENNELNDYQKIVAYLYKYKWYASDPPDSGVTVRTSLSHSENDIEKIAETQYNFASNSSMSNGFLMRAPGLIITGYLLGLTADQVAQLTIQDTVLTNKRIQAQVFADIYARSLYRLLENAGNNKLAKDNSDDVYKLIDFLVKKHNKRVGTGENSFAEAIYNAHAHAKTNSWNNIDSKITYIIDDPEVLKFSNTNSSEITYSFDDIGNKVVGVVYHAFVLLLNILKKASESKQFLNYTYEILSVVSNGGDTDTNAAIVGPFLGILADPSTIPKSWIETMARCSSSFNRKYFLSDPLHWINRLNTLADISEKIKKGSNTMLLDISPMDMINQTPSTTPPTSPTSPQESPLTKTKIKNITFLDEKDINRDVPSLDVLIEISKDKELDSPQKDKYESPVLIKTKQKLIDVDQLNPNFLKRKCPYKKIILLLDVSGSTGIGSIKSYRRSLSSEAEQENQSINMTKEIILAEIEGLATILFLFSLKFDMINTAIAFYTFSSDSYYSGTIQINNQDNVFTVINNLVSIFRGVSGGTSTYSTFKAIFSKMHDNEKSLIILATDGYTNDEDSTNDLLDQNKNKPYDFIVVGAGAIHEGTGVSSFRNVQLSDGTRVARSNGIDIQNRDLTCPSDPFGRRVAQSVDYSSGNSSIRRRGGGQLVNSTENKKMLGGSSCNLSYLIELTQKCPNNSIYLGAYGRYEYFPRIINEFIADIVYKDTNGVSRPKFFAPIYKYDGFNPGDHLVVGSTPYPFIVTAVLNMGLPLIFTIEINSSKLTYLVLPKIYPDSGTQRYSKNLEEFDDRTTDYLVPVQIKVKPANGEKMDLNDIYIPDIIPISTNGTYQYMYYNSCSGDNMQLFKNYTSCKFTARLASRSTLNSSSNTREFQFDLDNNNCFKIGRNIHDLVVKPLAQIGASPKSTLPQIIPYKEPVDSITYYDYYKKILNEYMTANPSSEKYIKLIIVFMDIINSDTNPSDYASQLKIKLKNILLNNAIDYYNSSFESKMGNQSVLYEGFVNDERYNGFDNNDCLIWLLPFTLIESEKVCEDIIKITHINSDVVTTMLFLRKHARMALRRMSNIKDFCQEIEILEKTNAFMKKILEIIRNGKQIHEISTKKISDYYDIKTYPLQIFLGFIPFIVAFSHNAITPELIKKVDSPSIINVYIPPICSEEKYLIATDFVKTKPHVKLIIYALVGNVLGSHFKGMNEKDAVELINAKYINLLNSEEPFPGRSDMKFASGSLTNAGQLIIISMYAMKLAYEKCKSEEIQGKNNKLKNIYIQVASELYDKWKSIKNITENHPDDNYLVRAIGYVSAAFELKLSLEEIQEIADADCELTKTTNGFIRFYVDVLYKLLKKETIDLTKILTTYDLIASKNNIIDYINYYLNGTNNNYAQIMLLIASKESNADTICAILAPIVGLKAEPYIVPYYWIKALINAKSTFNNQFVLSDPEFWIPFLLDFE
jgi:ADP-ribosylglycohydrolase